MSRPDGKGRERRKHHRLPFVEGLIEPITFHYAPAKLEKGEKPAKSSKLMTHDQPAILTNLSAGGMSLIMFAEPPHVKAMHLELTLPGLPNMPIEAKIVRVHMKGETYNLGLQFTKIQKKHQNSINHWAEDHMDCETRIALSLPEACVPTCRYNALCQKPQKAPHWPKKS
ncbi:MAG: PilZ domain-containing protein [Elusimicrobia bacterium]|nr:PilZ domain-containing protein [Elusimicrobiota bacterium]